MGKQKDKKAIEIAKYMQRRLVGMGYIVHRYDAFSTGSVYLKVDYGLGGSIRIANHKGIKYLNYRFNISTDEEGEGVESIPNKVCDRHFYKSGSINKLLSDICEFREGRVVKYGGIQRYLNIMGNNKEENKESKGFWIKAREIKIGRIDLTKDWLLCHNMTPDEMENIVGQVSRTNEKLAILLKNTKFGWWGLNDKLLELVLVRYKEILKQ